MKRTILILCLIAACAALCAAVLPRSTVPEETPAAVVERKAAAEVTALPVQTEPLEIEELPQAPGGDLKAEKENAPEVSPQSTTITQTPTPLLQGTKSAQPAGYDPYHTDVYPNNVYSEEYEYDENGNKVGIMGGDDEVSGEYAVPKATPECVYYTPEELANGRPPMPTTSNKPVVPDDYSPSVIAG